jgi:microcystin-dependent protein
MKKLLLLNVILALSTGIFAQVGIGTSTPHASAQLDVTSSSKGLLMPRMTASQRTAISTPATGLLVFQTDGSSGMYYYTGSEWIRLQNDSDATPTGTILPFAGSVAPSGYQLCDGSSLNRSSYSKLFAVIGTTYGSADGASFKVPDLRGRTIIGAGTGSGLSTRTLGANGGAETHTLTINEMPSHNHTINDPSHAHTSYIGRDDGNNSNIDGQAPPGDAAANRLGAATTSSTTGISINNNGGGAAHNNMQPYTVLNYIIKL